MAVVGAFSKFTTVCKDNKGLKRYRSERINHK